MGSLDAPWSIISDFFLVSFRYVMDFIGFSWFSIKMTRKWSQVRSLDDCSRGPREKSRTLSDFSWSETFYLIRLLFLEPFLMPQTSVQRRKKVSQEDPQKMPEGAPWGEDGGECFAPHLVWHWSPACFADFFNSHIILIIKSRKSCQKSTFKNKCGHEGPRRENRPPWRRRVLRTILNI